MVYCGKKSANKALVQNAPALCNFALFARHMGLGGDFGFILSPTAGEQLHNAGVEAVEKPHRNARFLQPIFFNTENGTAIADRFQVFDSFRLVFILR